MVSSPAAVLQGISEGFREQQFDLGPKTTRLGRGSSCSIFILDSRVSREHAEIHFEAGSFVITDLGSTHGTFVDGERTQHAQLQDGASIRLGDTEFIFRLVQDAIPTRREGREGLPAEVSPALLNAAPTPTVVNTPQPAPRAGQVSESRGSQAPIAKRGRSKLLIGCGVLAFILVGACLAVTLLVAVFYPGGFNAAADRILGRATAGYSDADLALALGVATVDERPQILESFGPPDEFDMAIIEVDGGQVRRESWYYYGFGTRIDFVDGTIVWTIDLEPSEEGVFPTWYDPTIFVSGMSIESASSAVAAASPAGTLPQAIDLAPGGDDLAGAIMLVGDQITLAFQDGSLVYVETTGVKLGANR